MSYRVNQKETSMAVSLLTGFAISWILTTIATIIITILVFGERLGEDAIQPAAVITMMVATFISSVLAGKMQSNKRLLICLAGGVVYYASLVGCNALFYDGEYNGLLGGLLTITGCSLVAGLVITRQKRQRPSYLKGLSKS